MKNRTNRVIIRGKIVKMVITRGKTVINTIIRGYFVKTGFLGYSLKNHRIASTEFSGSPNYPRLPY